MPEKKESKTQLIAAKVTPSIKKKLEAKAARADRTVSYYVNQALEKYFEKN